MVKKILVALSGGKDSTALLHKTFKESDSNQYELIGAVIVDHAMRPESAQESLTVQNYWQQKWHIKVHILTYEEDKKLRNQKQAREFRLNSLSLFAIKNHIDEVWLGHNLEDKIETYLLRKERESTFWGLASIGQSTTINGIKFYRPFLHTPRTYIEDYIKTHQLFYIEDSSNQKDIYRRNYIRHHLLSQHNKGELLNTINHHVAQRIYYDHIISKWTSMHLIKVNNFMYKFLWNRLPTDTVESKLILAHLVHLIRGRPVQNWENISLERKNCHWHNVTFTFRGDYVYAREYITEPLMIFKKFHKDYCVFIDYKVLLYALMPIECQQHIWPLIKINGITYDLPSLPIKFVIDKNTQGCFLDKNYFVQYK